MTDEISSLDLQTLQSQLPPSLQKPRLDVKFISPLYIHNCRRRLEQYNKTIPAGCFSMISETKIVTSSKPVAESTYYFAVRQQYRSRLDMLREQQHWLWSPMLVSGYIHRLKKRETLVLASIEDPFSGKLKIFAIHMVPVVFLWIIGAFIYLSFRDNFLIWAAFGFLLMWGVAVYAWYIAALERAALLGVVRDAFGYISGTDTAKAPLEVMDDETDLAD